ncbi:MAG: response regulator transcription factor [Limnochordaceae bacterium]|nr:response regulator transcription factor [Limnochordaceae bacterium]
MSGVRPARDRIRIVVVEAHEVFRTGLRLILERQPDMEVVADLPDAGDLQAVVDGFRPDVVLFGTCHRARQTQAIEWLSRRRPSVATLVLMVHPELSLLRELVRAGTCGLFLARSPASELCRAVRTVAGGALYVDPDVAQVCGLSPQLPGPRGRAELSDREWHVLRLLALGYSRQEIARRVGVSVKTVDTYRSRICEKLGLRERSDLVRYALCRGLVQEEC